jgi:hypothetical protein
MYAYLSSGMDPRVMLPRFLLAPLIPTLQSPLDHWSQVLGKSLTMMAVAPWLWEFHRPQDWRASLVIAWNPGILGIPGATADSRHLGGIKGFQVFQ